jgi:mannose-1-phosphate guanylyltransferase
MKVFKKTSIVTMKRLFIFCLLLVLIAAGCKKKPELVRIKDLPLPEEVKEVSVWDCEGVGKNGTPVDAKKTNANKDPNHVSQVLNALCEIEDEEEYVTACMNLLCFETEKGIFCVDIDHAKPIFGYGYIDTEGKLEKALKEAGLMPVPYEPNLP